ncbi:plasmid mobilization relaxosome protein MobC [Parashewanella spongiae]|uniref:Plasmid mobilization relaxosome protein MobC n=1 Tax=Parashewanella spongiae TaxID=342950 RepID=A0A3A6T5G8_9GAMM|nr:plasmid mobilization relaxosome protein MobC [Parashewanella spongiae]MCL1080203.1 plasmid mobilization relaxosome protein MobC [Parashewanella spongiae]RJY01900.1 plasmid mobilization relaxosome protein MobC [Parashewanella spongiae]
MGVNLTKTLLSEVEKSNWKNFCNSHGMSEAEMLRMLINRVSPEASNTDHFRENRNDKVTVRLSNENHKKLSYRAKSEGYLSDTSWVNASVMANLYREPILTQEEMGVLRDSNRQLAAIGRNLNQIARVLNIEFRESDKITKSMIQGLSEQINEHKNKVYKLLHQNRHRWNIHD